MPAIPGLTPNWLFPTQTRHDSRCRVATRTRAGLTGNPLVAAHGGMTGFGSGGVKARARVWQAGRQGLAALAALCGVLDWTSGPVQAATPAEGAAPAARGGAGDGPVAARQRLLEVEQSIGAADARQRRLQGKVAAVESRLKVTTRDMVSLAAAIQSRVMLFTLRAERGVERTGRLPRFGW